MAIVVAGIVDDLDMREADEADDEEAEQCSQRQAAMAREAAEVPMRRGKPKPCSSVLSFRPPPEGTASNVRRRQVSWLADHRPSPPSRGDTPQWHLGRATAYSCGGSHGFGQHARTAFPLGSSRNRRQRDYRQKRNARQTKFTDNRTAPMSRHALCSGAAIPPRPAPAAATDGGRGCRALRGSPPCCADSRRRSPNGRRPTPARAATSSSPSGPA